MTSSKNLSEVSIQTALAQGYITSKEARDMLRLYLHKSSLPSNSQKPTPSHHRTQQSR